MYIRIKFCDLESSETEETMMTLLGSPSGTALSSKNNMYISLRHLLNRKDLHYWYLDDDIIENHYNGYVSTKNHLLSFTGVESVSFLPIINVPRPTNDTECINLEHMIYECETTYDLERCGLYLSESEAKE